MPKRLYEEIEDYQDSVDVSQILEVDMDLVSAPAPKKPVKSISPQILWLASVN